MKYDIAARQTVVRVFVTHIMIYRHLPAVVFAGLHHCVKPANTFIHEWIFMQKHIFATHIRLSVALRLDARRKPFSV